MIKKIFVDVLLLEFHFFFTSKSVEQYFVKPKMKSSFQWDYPRIMKFRFSVYCKVRVIDFPIDQKRYRYTRLNLQFPMA